MADHPVVNDGINQPSHYNIGRIPVIDFIEDQQLGFHLGSVVTYVCRAHHKGELVKDLRKAIWYTNRELERLGYKPVVSYGTQVTLSPECVDVMLKENEKQAKKYAELNTHCLQIEQTNEELISKIAELRQLNETQKERIDALEADWHISHLLKAVDQKDIGIAERDKLISEQAMQIENLKVQLTVQQVFSPGYIDALHRANEELVKQINKLMLQPDLLTDHRVKQRDNKIAELQQRIKAQADTIDGQDVTRTDVMHANGDLTKQRESAQQVAYELALRRFVRYTL
jgi:Protein of unknwon function (DUF3310)